MRYFAIGAVLGSFLVAAARLAFRGDAFATALLIGFGSPLLMLGAAALSSAKAEPRKADPAKIARLEVDLQTGPAWEKFQREQAHKDRVAKMGCTDPDCSREHYMVGGIGPRLHIDWGEAKTTVAKPPAERSVDDCPRPEGCVVAHACWKCGADRGQACVDDPYMATFHGAPTFGHKIEGP